MEGGEGSASAGMDGWPGPDERTIGLKPGEFEAAYAALKSRSSPVASDDQDSCHSVALGYELLSVDLAGNFLKHLLVNIEVGVDVLYVVVLLEGFHQANHRRGLLAFQLDVGIRNHAHARRSRLDAGFL